MFDITSICSITKNVRLGQIVRCNSYRNSALLVNILSVIDIFQKGELI